jgi:hypothetical protein
MSWVCGFRYVVFLRLGMRKRSEIWASPREADLLLWLGMRRAYGPESTLHVLSYQAEG